MFGGLVAGVVVGLGLFLVGRGLFPRPQELRRRLHTLHTPASSTLTTPEHFRVGWQRWAEGLLGGTGVDAGSLAPDLAIVGRSRERHAIDKLTLGAFGLALPVGFWLLLRLGGVRFPPMVVALLSVALAAAFFFVPDMALRQEATRRRREFRYALGTFLDLVTIILAGGGGVETALRDASDAGNGWVFAHLRHSLAVSQLTNGSPWEGFEQLAEQLAVDELLELSSSIALAGTSGARVRQSLKAKAMSVRDHELADAEADAAEASNRMGAPVAAMLVGFILLIGFPAVSNLLSM